MPGTHVALIRGINVGKAKRVAMGDLRDLLATLGYRDVRSLLNSGNLVFTAGRAAPVGIAARIQEAMAERLGVSARVMVLTREMYTTVVEQNALHARASDATRLLVAFCVDGTRLEEMAPLAKKSWKPEALAIGSHAAYVWCPDGILESALLDAVGRTLGDATTTRNWATVMKVHDALLAEDSGR